MTPEELDDLCERLTWYPEGVGHTIRAEALAAIKALRAHVEELQLKIDPEQSCACSYDEPGQVCLHHAPAIKALREEVERAKIVADKAWVKMDEQAARATKAEAERDAIIADTKGMLQTATAKTERERDAAEARATKAVAELDEAVMHVRRWVGWCDGPATPHPWDQLQEAKAFLARAAMGEQQ